MTRAHSIIAPSRRHVAPMPATVAPMLAIAGDLPIDPAHWAFEFKWDGVRCLSIWDGKSLKLLSRNQRVITQSYPDLMPLGRVLGRRQCILDGEIVALDAKGGSSFARLQRRMHVDRPTPELIRTTPIWFILFDLLHLGTRSLLNVPYSERREKLEGFISPGDAWQLSPSHVGQGAGMFETAKRNEMEGLVAKLIESPYTPGKRSPAWRKIKLVTEQEFVIGGWVPEASDRTGRIGALLLGYYDDSSSGELHYAGRVGTGFSDQTHAMLTKRLLPLRTTRNPFNEGVPGSSINYVRPMLIAQTEYRRWPAGGLIQHTAFKGLRGDKSPKDVHREMRGSS